MNEAAALERTGGFKSAFFPSGATPMAPTDGCVRIGTGRDATDAPFSTLFGTAERQQMTVWAVNQQSRLANEQRMGPHLIVIMAHLGQASTLSRGPGASFECRHKTTIGLTEPKGGSALSGRQCLPPPVVGVPLLSLLFAPSSAAHGGDLFAVPC